MLFKFRKNKQDKSLEQRIEEFEQKLNAFDSDIQKEFDRINALLEKTQKVIDKIFNNDEYTFEEMKPVSSVEDCPIYRSYTQKEIAELYGVTHFTIKKWEKNYYRPKEFIGRIDVEESKVEQLAKEYRERKADEQKRFAHKRYRKNSTTGV